MTFTPTAVIPPRPPGPRASTTFRRLDLDAPTVVHGAGRRFITVDASGLRHLAFEAFKDISHLLRTSHLKQVANILDDPEASANDRFVALELLRNAHIAAAGVLPMCQDTGTAIVHARRGHAVLTDGHDDDHISHGIYDAYSQLNLRYSQMAPRSMFDEFNTGTNLPAQIEIAAAPGADYELLFMAKGCGSANKSFLFQETAATLRPDTLLDFVVEKAAAIGTSACPPYHLAIVIGGTSGEFALRTAKLASAHELDYLPDHGGDGSGYRDGKFEDDVLSRSRELGIGAQFGGKYFCHDVRVIRLPRHGGSLPIAIAVSCAADRQAVARIDETGYYLEELERDPGRFLPETVPEEVGDSAVAIDLDQPMSGITDQLSGLPVGTRLSLTGRMIVARDLAHAKIKDRLDRGEPLPDYLRDHPVYYAGPAKTPRGLASGSFGPTTAGRMDTYVEQFQAAGGSLVMLAKGNRSPAVAKACRAHGGFYLGSIGGPAARLAHDCIKRVATVEYVDLGMEAVFEIDVENFPAFVVINDRGDDFYARPTLLEIGAVPAGR